MCKKTAPSKAEKVRQVTHHLYQVVALVNDVLGGLFGWPGGTAENPYQFEDNPPN